MKPSTLGTVAALAVVSLVLAGCSSSSSGGSGNPTTTAVPSSTTVGSAASTSTTIVNNPALRGNVSITKCAAAPGGWLASGTAITGAAASTYSISIDFVTLPGDTVEGSGQTTVKVPGGGTAQWSITAQFTPTSNMNCVLEGVG